MRIKPKLTVPPCAVDEVETREETLWESIVRELDEEDAILSQYIMTNREGEAERSFVTMDRRSWALCYLKRYIYPILLPVLKHTFQQARLEQALIQPRCKFNPIDHVVYLLYNLDNAQSRERDNTSSETQDLTRLYDIPFVRDILSSEHRAVYPASWLWSMDEAATVIQKCARGYAVRRDREVKEMRRFWEIIKEEEGEI
ncbi:hypothetical protein M8J76_015001 [Diaphorina citri]|nr:hypothetical protein M8J75_002582 [Diaphorina citri]KAI5719798.1 hypothetical protein M8J76_015001 [Diaphorina citri]KAI5720884.1 hypothetical protein M8J77_012929 [Diaphorina citri]